MISLNAYYFLSHSNSFYAKLSVARTVDRHSLTKAWRQSKTDHERQAVLQQLAGSLQHVETLQSRMPALHYPDLPVANQREDIVAAIREHQVIVLCGDTGSGKTTQLPKLAIEAGQGARGLIGHTQPRRIAARNVAARIADELGTSLGEQVGFKIRFTDQVSKQSVIKVMTDGILLAETQQDRFLDAYDTIIIDEAHERSLNIDFLLGYFKQLLPKRSDLKIIITSATIDPERFAEHFGNDTPIITVPGRTYPVDVQYLPGEDDSTLVQSVLDGVAEATRLDKHGDMLIFLPTERDIRECSEALTRQHFNATEVLPLFARLTPAEQQRIFNPGQQRRIVLATNVAETSLTVPRIKFVIDSGLARVSRYSWRSKLQRLPIERISQASADQRKGRCGRIAPGICIRLYAEDDFTSRAEFTEPEIQRTNLASVILQMHSLQLGDLAAFPFIDPPDSRFIADGERLLTELGALKNDRLTTTGRQLARFPVDPTLARMLIAASEKKCLQEMLVIVAALSIIDPRERPTGSAAKADEAHKKFEHPKSDYFSLYALWLEAESARESLSGSAFRRWCKAHYLHYLRMREWRDIHHQLMSMARATKLKLNAKPQCNTRKLHKDDALYAQVHQAILTGLNTHVGLRDDSKTKPKMKVSPGKGRGAQPRKSMHYLTTQNAGFQLWPGSSVTKAAPKWVVYLERLETAKVYGRVLAEVQPDWIEQAAKHLIKREVFEPHYNGKTGRVDAYAKLMLRGLVLAEKRRMNFASFDPVVSREIFIREALVNQRYKPQKPPAFWRHNSQLIKQLEQAEHKSRRRDLLINDDRLMALYLERVPAAVVDLTTFENWLKTTDEDQLKFSETDLREGESDIDQNDFPEAVIINNVPLKLDYQFDPGGKADGVTIVASAAVLNQISEQRLEWLVPGLLEDKLLAMLKALPKRYRRHFVPAPQYAQALHQRITEQEVFGEGNLFAKVRQHLFQMTGNEIPEDAWDEAKREGRLPEHLRMNIRVVDAKQKALRQGRKLDQLQQASAAEAAEVFTQVAENSKHRLECSGQTAWGFADLPDSVMIKRGGVTLNAYPAVVAEGETVGVQLFDTPEKAAHAHRRGLLKLCRLQLNNTVTYLQKKLPHGTRLELAFTNMPSRPHLFAEVADTVKSSLINELINCVLEDLLVETSVRTRAAFETALAAKERSIVAAATDLSVPLLAILEQYPPLRAQLNSTPPLGYEAAYADMLEQLDHLIFKGFLQVTTAAQLQQFKRYCQALQFRLDKLDDNPKRDGMRMAEVRALWEPLSKMPVPDSLEHNWWKARWMIEELRVSQFAQQLGTQGKVSVKRIESLLNAC